MVNKTESNNFLTLTAFTLPLFRLAVFAGHRCLFLLRALTKKKKKNVLNKIKSN